MKKSKRTRAEIKEDRERVARAMKMPLLELICQSVELQEAVYKRFQQSKA